MPASWSVSIGFLVGDIFDGSSKARSISPFVKRGCVTGEGGLELSGASSLLRIGCCGEVGGSITDSIAQELHKRKHLFESRIKYRCWKLIMEDWRKKKMRCQLKPLGIKFSVWGNTEHKMLPRNSLLQQHFCKERWSLAKISSVRQHNFCETLWEGGRGQHFTFTSRTEDKKYVNVSGDLHLFV